MRKIIFGIRKSRLAKAQLDELIAHLQTNDENVDFEVKEISTKGDENTNVPVEQLGQGVFIKELENRLLAKEIDCAVHSLKDMPVKIAEGTSLACFLPRADERDCLLWRENTDFESIKHKKIATSSPRRQAFMKELDPGVEPVSLRGNVDTRLKKLDEGQFDAMILAACGLKRLGLEKRISKYLDSDFFVPAAGQGIICAQTREDDTELLDALKNINDPDTEFSANAERKILEKFEIGCQKPFGVFARFVDDKFIMTAKIYRDKCNCFLSSQKCSLRKDALMVIQALAMDLKEKIESVNA